MSNLLKLGFVRQTREKAVDKLLDINIEEKTNAPKSKRKKFDTLAVGVAGASSMILPGVPFQAAAAKALAPKEKADRAAVDATTGSFLGTATGGSYLAGSVIKDKGGVKPAVNKIKSTMKPKSNPSKAKNINMLGKRISKVLPSTTVSGSKLEKNTKIPVEKIQRALKGIGKYKSKLKGATIFTALGSGIGSALGYERSLKRNQEKKYV